MSIGNSAERGSKGYGIGLLTFHFWLCTCFEVMIFVEIFEII